MFVKIFYKKMIMFQNGKQSRFDKMSHIQLKFQCSLDIFSWSVKVNNMLRKTESECRLLLPHVHFTSVNKHPKYNVQAHNLQKTGDI